MSGLHMYLLGQSKLYIGATPCKLSLRKAEALLYFCFFSKRPLSVLTLCDIFWPTPDFEETQARRHLNNALYRLNKDLRSIAAPGNVPTYLGRSKDKEMVAFHRDCAHSCDVEDFEALVRDATGQTPLSTLEQAFKLYQGPFLADFSPPDAPDFDRWVEAKR